MFSAERLAGNLGRWTPRCSSDIPARSGSAVRSRSADAMVPSFAFEADSDQLVIRGGRREPGTDGYLTQSWASRTPHCGLYW
jgi:hypothetical protein